MANKNEKKTTASSAKKKQVPNKTETKKNIEKTEKNDTSPAVKRQKTAIILMAAAVFLICLSFIEGDSFWFKMHNTLFGVFGFCAYILPVILIYMAVIYAKDKPLGSIAGNLAGTGVLVALLSGAIHIFANTPEFLKETSLLDQIKDAWSREASIGNGGFFGAVIGGLSSRFFGKVGAGIIVVILIAVVVMLLTGTTLLTLFATLKKPVDKVGEFANEKFEQSSQRREQMIQQREEEKKQKKSFNPPQKPTDLPDDFEDKFITDETTMIPPEKRDQIEIPLIKLPDATPTTIVEETVDAAVKEKKTRKKKDLFNADSEPSATEKNEMISKDVPNDTLSDDQNGDKEYVFPPIDCLELPQKTGSGDPIEEMQRGGKKLIETLDSFKVKAEITNISRGPSVTRYELLPDAGVRINKITQLSDDIALRLAAKTVRIEAPIPGKAAIGIEVPNNIKSIVSMREMIDTPEFRTAKSKLNVVLGKDIAGNIISADLAKMPHLLVAGTTGSGKSVCMNSMIVSLLYNATPDEVKLLMIDPKMVEFTVYNGIAHLEVPVVADPRKAAGALSWAVSEMEKRYKLFSENGIRDIKGYNSLCESRSDLEKLHRIVIFIDELADLMMVAPKDVEESICRLAQKARAAGIHLVVATQRPTVDVITGLIKANIPSRIALMVSSNIDSRTILDQSGAEKLLGNGDLLFMPVGQNKPVRVQGCFVSDSEIARVVDHIKNQVHTEYDDDIRKEIELKALATETGKKTDDYSNESNDLDPMFDEAAETVVLAGQASTTMLQKKLKLGYARASRVMDQLEENGIVGPSEGAKPRAVLVSKSEWYERQALADGARAASKPEQLKLDDIYEIAEDIPDEQFADDENDFDD